MQSRRIDFRTKFVLGAFALYLLAAAVASIPGVKIPRWQHAAPAVPINQVTLNASPGNVVQMFANPGSGADAFADFPNGTKCTKFGDPITVTFSGTDITSRYYKVRCNNQHGYINVKWVH